MREREVSLSPGRQLTKSILLHSLQLETNELMNLRKSSERRRRCHNDKGNSKVRSQLPDWSELFATSDSGRSTIYKSEKRIRKLIQVDRRNNVVPKSIVLFADLFKDIDVQIYRDSSTLSIFMGPQDAMQVRYCRYGPVSVVSVSLSHKSVFYRNVQTLLLKACRQCPVRSPR